MTVEARLTRGGVCRTIPLTQYDEGQKIHLNGIILPASYLAEFANSESGTAEQITQTTDTVLIPDKYLTSGNPVYVWIVVVGEDERTTRYEIIVPVRGRGEPDDYVPTPEEQTAIEAAIAALNQAVTAAGVAIEHYPKIEGGYWYVWDVSSGEWISTGVPAQGPQGETGATGNGIASAVLNADYTLTLTFTNGQTYTTPSIRGAQGAQGQDGAPGADGYSPTASVSKSGNTATITITDKDGTTTAQISDGATGQTGPAGTDGSPGASAYVWIRYAATEPMQDSDMKTTPDAWMGIYSGDSATAPTAYTAYTWYNIKGQTGPVQDVQVNGTSILNNGVANVPVAGTTSAGVIRLASNNGLFMDGTILRINRATDALIKSGDSSYFPIVPINQNKSVFYGLAKAAGDSTQSASSNAVGTYTDAAKVAIQKMLGIYEAPWELIREDTVTNATEADIEITVDGNGNAFELTDIKLMFWLPQQETQAAKADYGKINFYYANDSFDTAYGGALQAGQILIDTIEQKDGMVTISFTNKSNIGDSTAIYSATYLSGAGTPITLGSRVYMKIAITKVTGMASYRLYGKRKWTA